MQLISVLLLSIGIDAEGIANRTKSDSTTKESLAKAFPQSTVKAKEALRTSSVKLNAFGQSLHSFMFVTDPQEAEANMRTLRGQSASDLVETLPFDITKLANTKRRRGSNIHSSKVGIDGTGEIEQEMDRVTKPLSKNVNPI